MQRTRFFWPKVCSGLITLIFSGFLILSQITFAPSLGKWVYMLNVHAVTTHWIFGIIANYGLNILFDAAILWGLIWILRRRLTVADAGHFWLLTFWLGWGIAFVLLAVGFPFWPQNVYNSTLLLSRNGYPFFTGLFCYFLIQPWAFRHATDKRFALGLIGLLTLNLLSGLEPLKTGTGVGFTAAILFACAAQIMVARPKWLTRQWWFTLPLGSLSIVFMGWYQATRQATMTTTGRFVIALSPLTLIPAILLVQWLRQHAPKVIDDHRSRWWKSVFVLTLWTSFLIGTGAAYSNLWVRTANILKKHLQFLGPLWVLVSSALLVSFAFVLSLVVFLLVPRLRTWTRLSKHWALDFAQALQHVVTTPRIVFSRIWHEYWRPAVAFVVMYLVQCVSCLLMNQSWHMTELMTHANDNIISSTVIHGVAKMLCGTLIMLAAYWVVLALFNRYWLALISVSTFSLGFAVAARLKILSRSEPIVPADIAELSQFKELLSLVSPLVLVVVLLLLIIAIGAIAWLEHHSANAQQSWPTRIIKFALSLWFIIGFGSLNHGWAAQRNVLHALGVYTESNLDELLYAQQNGPLMAFISMTDVKLMDRPAGYSKATMQKLVKRYNAVAKNINRTRTTDAKDVTIMFNLSESFSDPTAITGIKLNQEPIPYISKLKQTTTSGRMLAASFGGGTANMEYMSLTGMSMGLFNAGVVPNNMVVPNQSTAPNIGNLFSYDSAIHPYTGGYYNRQQVYHKFDFNKFQFLGSAYPITDQKRIGKSIYLSDQTAYANAYKQITSRKSGQFINLITMQNHMPYTQDWYPDHDYKVSGTGFTRDQKLQIQRYTQGIHYTDNAVKSFIKQLDALNKPVIMVFYGDHLPGVYTLPTAVDKFATDYFIYANKYARTHGAKKKLANKQYVATNDFIALALEQANAKVDGYSALLTKVADQLPAIWQSKELPAGYSSTDQLFVGANGKLTSATKLSAKQRQLLVDYQMLQYDITAGKSYATKLGFTTTVAKAK